MRGISPKKISQFDPGVWAVGGVPSILVDTHFLFRALLYSVVPFRFIKDECMQNLITLCRVKKLAGHFVNRVNLYRRHLAGHVAFSMPLFY